MLTTLVWIDIVLYSLTVLLMLVVESVSEDKDPLWEQGLDVALLGAGLAGMLFFQLQPQVAGLKTAWKIVVPVLAVVQLVLNLWSRRQLVLTDEELAEGLKQQIDGLTILVLVPSLIINGLYAYG